MPEKQTPVLAIPTGLNSDVFNQDKPPKDWADVGFLIPHEAIRREMKGMVESVMALPVSTSKGKDDWKVLYFSEFYLDYFHDSVHEHHDAEEQLYFPFIKERAEYPEERFSKSHEELLAAMDDIKETCLKIQKKRGIGCAEEITSLKECMPKFVEDMSQHLKEEEETFPGLARPNFTFEEEQVVVQKIIKNGGLGFCKKLLPAIIISMENWATPEYRAIFNGNIPAPIRYLLYNFFLPNYKNVALQMRDAPLLEKKPTLTRVKCFGFELFK